MAFINLSQIPARLSTPEFILVIKPTLFFIFGIAIYSIFIFKFYKFLARKDIFTLDLNQYNIAKFAALKKFLSVIFYIIEYILLFPLFVFFWFAVLTLLLVFLSKEQDINSIIIVSMALVSAIRITAYYNEDLSRDLSKMMPFALLGVYLVNITYFSFSESIILLKMIPKYAGVLLYYFIFIIALEFTLRALHSFLKPILPSEESD